MFINTFSGSSHGTIVNLLQSVITDNENCPYRKKLDSDGLNKRRQERKSVVHRKDFSFVMKRIGGSIGISW